MFGHKSFLTSLACALISCGPVHNEIRPDPAAIGNIRTIAVSFPQQGEFAVFNERAKANAAPAVAGMFGLVGLIGVAAVDAQNVSADGKQAKAFGASLEQVDCRAPLQSSFEHTLKEAKRFVAYVYNRPLERSETEGVDGILEFDIHHCGFRLVDQNKGEVAAFVELSAHMTPSGSRNAIWDDRESITGSDRYSLSTLNTDPELVRKEFIKVLQDAGARLANQLLYP